MRKEKLRKIIIVLTITFIIIIVAIGILIFSLTKDKKRNEWVGTRKKFYRRRKK